MDAEKVLKLIDAGFSADEIRGMLAPSAEPKTEPEAKEEPKKAPEAPKEEPAKEDPVDAAMKAAQQKMDSFNAAMDSMIEKISIMAGMPAIGTTAPKGVEDVVSDFFKEEN